MAGLRVDPASSATRVARVSVRADDLAALLDAARRLHRTPLMTDDGYARLSVVIERVLGELESQDDARRDHRDAAGGSAIEAWVPTDPADTPD
jgi:hypothetical protein